MNRACIVACYFGKLPAFFPLWLESAKANKTYDFLLVTDNDVDYIKADNFRILNMQLEDLEKLAQKKLNFPNARLKTGYKCCDYKPVYGVVFEDFLKEYEFVGYCDFDVIFGDLDKFLTDDLWEKYDKLLPLGHLAFIRNTNKVLNYYKLEAKNVFADYKKAFTKDIPCIFDEEQGINTIYVENNLPLLREYFMADISERNDRLKLTDNIVNKSGNKNYDYQVFYYENGKIFRSYIDNGVVGQDEFIYLHAKKRYFNQPDFNNKEVNAVYVLPHDFVEKEPGEITIEDIKARCTFISDEYDEKEKKKWMRKDLYKRGVNKWKRIMRKLFR